MVLRVAVIGGGAAGLCAARNLLSDGAHVVVFEQAVGVGGTWDINNPQSSMYKSLRTNLPAPVMQFPDFEFCSISSFPSHADVCAYLRDYTARFELGPHIRLATRVVRAKFNRARKEWTVSSVDTQEVHSAEKFEAVVVCNGHYSHPKDSSNIPGLSSFTGSVIHSHNYRTPEPFKSVHRAVILGAGNSGVDISLELAQSFPSSEFLLSHRGCKRAPPTSSSGFMRLPNLFERPAVASIRGPATIEFEGGSIAEDVDAIILCTGYEYAFPFLSPETGDVDTPRIEVKENVVQGLYMHVFHAETPSLSFVGLPWKVVPFPLCHFQTQWISAVLCGRRSLPSAEEMQSVIAQDIQQRRSRGEPARYGHMLGDMQWEYNRRVCDAAGVPHDVPVRKNMYVDCGRARRADAIAYRRRHYIQLSPTDYRVTFDGVDVTR